MSDFNEVIKRVTTDRAFRADLLNDLSGTLSAHNYRVSNEELSELGRLDQSKLDQLDESLMEQVVGGGLTPITTITSASLTGLPLVQTSINTLAQQNFFSPFQRPGGILAASSTW